MTGPSTTAQDARRELVGREIVRVMREELRWPEVRDPDDATADTLARIAKRIAALRAEPARGAEEMRERAARCAETVEAWCEYVNIGEASSDGIAKAIRALPLTQETQGESDASHRNQGGRT